MNYVKIGVKLNCILLTINIEHITYGSKDIDLKFNERHQHRYECPKIER